MAVNKWDWQDVHGRRWRLSEIKDDHLVNIIHHMKRDESTTIFYKESIPKFEEEAKRRGITDLFHSRAQIPHKDPITGKFVLMQYPSCRLVKLTS